MKKNKPANVTHEIHGDMFFTTGVRIYNRAKDSFIFEFRQEKPVVVEDKGGMDLFIKRQTIVMSPLLAKSFIEVFKKNMEDYEKRNGELVLPKPQKQKPVIHEEETRTDPYIS